MKKVLPIVMTLVLAFSNVGFAAAAPIKTPAPAPVKVTVPVVVTKTGIVQSFTEKTVTVLENGMKVTYTLSPKTEVTTAGMSGDYATLIKKGLTVAFKAQSGMLSQIEIPNVGVQTQGTLSSNPVVSEMGILISNNINVVDVRPNATDSNIIPSNAGTTKYQAVVTGEEADDSYLLSTDGKKADIGDLDIVAGSLKVTLEDKPLTVLTTGAFNPATVGDEVKLVVTKTFASLEFEAPVTEAQKSKLKVEFKKVMRLLTATETTTVPLSENTIIELNGESVPFVVEGVSSYVATDLAGNAIYVDSFYKEQTMKFIGANGNKIIVAMMKDGVQVYNDIIEVTEDATVSSITGEPIDFHAIKSGSMVKLSVDPDFGYKVVELSVTK